MVDYISFGDINELAVHKEARVFSIGQTYGTFCVRDIFTFCPADAPFVFGKMVIIIRINNSILALCEGNFAKGVAETQTTIAKNKTNANSFNPSWDFDSDNQNQDAPSGDWWLTN